METARPVRPAAKSVFQEGVSGFRGTVDADWRLLWVCCCSVKRKRPSATARARIALRWERNGTAASADGSDWRGSHASPHWRRQPAGGKGRQRRAWKLLTQRLLSMEEDTRVSPAPALMDGTERA